VRRVQLPFNPQAEAAKVATAEDLARRAQLKVHTCLEAPDACARNPESWCCVRTKRWHVTPPQADNIQRLRDMHVARKQQRAEELAAKMQMLENTLEQATDPNMQPQQQQLVLVPFPAPFSPSPLAFSETRRLGRARK